MRTIADLLHAVIREEGLEAGLTAYRNLYANAPDNYDFGRMELIHLGVNYLQKKEFVEAEAIMQLSAETFPDWGMPYHGLGEVFLAQGSRAEARAAYEKALELDPDNQLSLRDWPN